MAKVKVYNLQGKEQGSVELTADIFDVEINPNVVHEVVEAQRANARQKTAHTKGRAEVRGGGKKPWRQKGTGRARHGSSRSPIWKGGGVTFGPRTERNFAKKVNKKTKRKALCMTLTDKVKENQFVVVDKIALSEIKTKAMIDALKKLPVDGNSALIVLPAQDQVVVKSVANIPKTKAIMADSLNVIDVLSHQYVVVSQDALDTIVKTYNA